MSAGKGLEGRDGDLARNHNLSFFFLFFPSLHPYLQQLIKTASFLFFFFFFGFDEEGSIFGDTKNNHTSHNKERGV